MTDREKQELYMWLVAEDFRLQNQLTELYNRFLSGRADNRDLFELILQRQRIADFEHFKTSLLWLLHLEKD